mmetsp:Transcript_17468/g.29716  ORF Transcript_17468/g.29716 Transcript_17468/m.29716 type:complete len:211 (-) Transcript_17468:1253-1885(-)
MATGTARAVRTVNARFSARAAGGALHKRTSPCFCTQTGWSAAAQRSLSCKRAMRGMSMEPPRRLPVRTESKKRKSVRAIQPELLTRRRAPATAGERLKVGRVRRLHGWAPPSLGRDRHAFCFSNTTLLKVLAIRRVCMVRPSSSHSRTTRRCSTHLCSRKACRMGTIRTSGRQRKAPPSKGGWVSATLCRPCNNYWATMPSNPRDLSSSI